MELRALQSPPIETAFAAGHDIVLRGHSYEERRTILPLVTEVVGTGSCWLKERRVVSFSQVEFVFEMQLRAAVEVYSALIGAGLELSPASHAELTGLCTVRRHDHTLRYRPGRVLGMRLEVSFLEESEFELGFGGVGLA